MIRQQQREGIKQKEKVRQKNHQPPTGVHIWKEATKLAAAHRTKTELIDISHPANFDRLLNREFQSAGGKSNIKGGLGPDAHMRTCLCWNFKKPDHIH